MISADNAEQQEFWSNSAGPKWVAHQSGMDHLMQPVLDGVLDRAQLAEGDRVLDIGCGGGASTVQAHDRVGADGYVLGADISDTLLDLAQRRTSKTSKPDYVLADAAVHAFEPASFDHLLSRFGVMFFADPAAAFTNMARALKPGGQLNCAAWGQIPANPFFTLCAQAAREVLGPVPKSDPDLPGPFAFRDPDRVLPVLTAAGLKNVRVEVETVMLTPLGSLHDHAERCASIGPAEVALNHHEADASQRAALLARIAELFAPYTQAGEFRIPAEINFYRAEA